MTDIEEAVWGTPKNIATSWVTLYEDRDLTRWERFRVHVLRRPDPRIVFNGPPDAAVMAAWERRQA